MKIIDISWPISSEMTAYKDRRTVSITATTTFEHDAVRETVLQLGSHSGTHVDAPAHFLREGKRYDQLPLELFIGSCTVIDLTNVKERIMREDVEQEQIPQGQIILCKTRNSYIMPTASFNYDFVSLELSAAQYMVDKKVKTVGIDYLGIERAQPNHDTHKELMRNGIGIIEGLRLAEVEAGEYILWCLPLAIVGTEAAPARAVLVRA